MNRTRALLTTLAVISAIAGPLLLWRLRPPPPPAAPADLPPACAQRGPVVFRPAPSSELQAVADEFRRRNGAGWHTDDSLPRGAGAVVDPISRTVRSSDTTAEAPGARLSAADAREMATDLVRRNADLLGIWPEELDLLPITVRPEPAGSWTTTFGATIPRPGYEELPSLHRTILVQVVTTDTGARRSIRTGPPPFPRFELCTIPLLGPDDAAVRRDIVGREFFLRGMGRTPYSLGRPAEADINGTPELIIDIDTTPAATTLTLAYRLIVMRNALALYLTVDADTGRFLREQPCEVSRTCATAAPGAAR